MSEKCILVTGGTRGLGLAISSRLKKDGYHVVASGRKCTPELEQLIQSPLPGGGQVAYEQIDLADFSSIHSRVLEIVRKQGSIYGLVNNAAIAHDGVLPTMHDTEIASVINVNVTGTILMTKYAVRSMLMEGRGRVVNISSIIASTGFNGLSVYGASKAALLGFTKSLARELGKAAITVNAISPGYMATDMSSGLDEEQLASIRRRSPLGLLTETHDVAHSVAFLLSDQAAAITGTNITIDAGSTA
jgi:3-oxoacyl-[acyl-carrier protein] reductase